MTISHPFGSRGVEYSSKAKRRIRGTRPEGTGLVPRGGLVPSVDFGSERFLKTKRRILGTTSLGTRSDCRSLTIPAQSGRKLSTDQNRVAFPRRFACASSGSQRTHEDIRILRTLKQAFTGLLVVR